MSYIGLYSADIHNDYLLLFGTSIQYDSTQIYKNSFIPSAIGILNIR